MPNRVVTVAALLHLHMFGRDLESLFYVIIWLTMRYENSVEIEDPPLESWAKSDSAQLIANKLFMFDKLPDPLPSFVKLKPMMSRLCKMFLDGLGARSNEEKDAYFDHETLSRHVTFTKFWVVCNTVYPTP